MPVVDPYTLTADEMTQDKRFRWIRVEDAAGQTRWFSRHAADRIKENNAKGQWTCMALPVGAVSFRELAGLLNSEKIHCRRLALVLLNEYLDIEGRPVAPTHPLSVARTIEEQFVKVVHGDLEFSRETLIVPNPQQLDVPARRLDEWGGHDAAFVQIGINGHLAFNEPVPVADARALDQLRRSTTRVVKLAESTVMQLAMTRLHGNLSLLPRFAATLGLKEILSAQRIVLFAHRPWHAGVLRRALFGPLSADFPASLLQEHHDVTVVLTKEAAAAPAVSEV